jgi:hypothetical protein
MKRKNIFKMMFSRIRNLFWLTNGNLLTNNIDLPDEYEKLKKDVLEDSFQMYTISEDKKNMRNDGVQLKKDAQKAAKAYKDEKSFKEETEYCY